MKKQVHPAELASPDGKAIREVEMMTPIEVIGAWNDYVLSRSAEHLFDEIWHDHVKPPAGTPDPYKIEKVAEILKGYLWNIMDATHRGRAWEQALRYGTPTEE